MKILFLILIHNIHLVSGVSLSDQVHQTPADMCKNPNETATLRCLHTISTYNRILWYKQSQGGQLQLLGYMWGSRPTLEANVSATLDGSADENKNCTLTIEKLQQDSNAVYFCAANNGEYEAYFGAGTKLTVLGKIICIEPPKVKVFKPSTKECQNEKHKKNKKTLLCVASDFYPDHVNVSWQIDGVDVKDGIATDHSAHWNGTHYRITSRLRVLFSQWFKPGKNFTCTVDFFDGEQTVSRVGWVAGIRNPGAAAIRNKYLKTTHNAKLSYLVLIIKSSIYGLFVIILVWKLQGFSRKPEK
uniref:immunoglobulin lambda-1 light chain n=1 Tax=Maylandia zebra TaxID=106582 RepID=UPI000D2FCBFB|nr:immunoglobulin lambda-1 light chain [Maylandia zebra]